MDVPFLAHLLNGLLMVLAPIGLGFFLSRRFHLGWRIWWIGAATFVLSQVGHIPFNSGVGQLIQGGFLGITPAVWTPLSRAIFLGLSAGLWEELSRYAAFRWWARDAQRSWHKGIWMGAGHGGGEAIILGLLVLYGFFNMVAVRDVDLSKLVPAAQLDLARQQVAVYWSAPPYYSLLGAVERFFTIPCQIAFSVLVLQSFMRKNFGWVGLAILWHALVDALAVYLSSLWASTGWGVYAIEGIIAIEAIISLGIIFALRRPEPEPDGPESILPSSPAPILPDKFDIPVTDENLDDSRYS